ncbi:MAG: hypothetical protein ACREDA_10440 [Methylocella sp.]
MEALYRARYQGFTAKHFHEHLVARHCFSWDYTWTTTFLQSKGVLEKAERRGAHRRKQAPADAGDDAASTLRQAQQPLVRGDFGCFFGPWWLSGKNGICEDEELSGASDKSELVRFAGGFQAAVQGGQCLVAFEGRRQSSGRDTFSHALTSTGDMAASSRARRSDVCRCRQRPSTRSG